MPYPSPASNPSPHQDNPWNSTVCSSLPPSSRYVTGSWPVSVSASLTPCASVSSSSKPLRFPLYPSRGDRHYFTVVLFGSLREMRRYDQTLTRTVSRSSRFVARMICFTPSGSSRLGELLFCLPYAGSGTIAHEMTHAALHYWTRHRKGDFDPCGDDKDDERLADTVDRLVRQYWSRFWKADASRKLPIRHG